MLFRSNRRLRRIELYLIKPSNYDDDGYVVRYFRGVLPSNTLACLGALTEDARKREALAALDFRVHLIDETVQRVNVKRIARSQRPGSKTIVGLIGVQTNQFPRASDLAESFVDAGVTVIVGGFHVSGSLAMLPETPQEIQKLMDLGVSIVKGEVEEEWGRILEDAVHGRLESLYDLTKQLPDLTSAPVPIIDRKLMKRYVSSGGGTIDCGRGCPFSCSFCTIINVQGRKMRFRSAETIAASIRQNYHHGGVRFYFFTDDNFARNPNWEKIFDALIDLRENEGIPVKFMMQVDVLSHRIRGFIEKARRAGCSNVFIGMESVNDDNLKAAKKNQNKVEDYRNLIQAYRDAEIATHVGYILGFPFDTPDSIRRDLDTLLNEVQVDMASFFVLTPLPGSQDHLNLFQNGAYMDSDFNKYDSMHETMNSPNFPEEGSLLASYQEAWETFYGIDNVRRILKRAPRRNYWNLFQNILWYRAAAVIEKRHPMMTGFLRLKRRTDVRPGVEPLSRMDYVAMRFRELKGYTVAALQLLLEMQLVWLETRHLSEVEEAVLAELRRLRRGGGLARVRLNELRTAYDRARESLPQLCVPGRFQLLVRKWSPLSLPPAFYSSRDVLDFWGRAVGRISRGRLSGIGLPVLLSRLWHDTRLAIHFAFAWRRGSTGGPEL
jgi:radical SAM superfamily enzyme YgiQ (UPF0313 family)